VLLVFWTAGAAAWWTDVIELIGALPPLFDFVPQCVSTINDVTGLATVVPVTDATATCVINAPGMFKARLIQP